MSVLGGKAVNAANITSKTGFDPLQIWDVQCNG
jgi:hypothetical protein